MSDLLYSEEEEALRSAVRDLLTDHCDAAAVLALVETAQPPDRDPWTALTAGMGLRGPPVPQATSLKHHSPPPPNNIVNTAV
ncbi:hypothetical protein RMO59_18800, partial [Streptomyces alfalfae]